MKGSVPILIRRRVTSDSANLIAVPFRLFACQITANGGNVDVALVDLATDDSSDLLTYSILDGDTRLFDYTNLEGIAFKVALTVDTTANAVIQLWTDQ